MEEILASIRRIISEDDSTKAIEQGVPAPKAPANAAASASRTPAPRVAPPEPVMPELKHSEDNAPARGRESPEDQAPDIFSLAESMAVPMPAPSPIQESERSAAPDVVKAEPDPGPELAAEASPAPAEELSQQAMIEEAAQSFAAQIASQRAMEDRRLISNATSAAVDSAFTALTQTVLVQNASTLEDLVKEMLRPMLKTWLDDNLPALVERLVRAEIERVSRGR